jgi:uncharacterized protein YqgV (UPF0045/DUF77 family)
MLAEFSIHPMDGVPLSGDVARAVEALGASVLIFRPGSMGACVEGDAMTVLDAIRRCHEAVAVEHDRVITVITIDDCRVRPHPLGELVPAVEQQLGARVPRGDMDLQC